MAMPATPATAEANLAAAFRASAAQSSAEADPCFHSVHICFPPGTAADDVQSDATLPEAAAKARFTILLFILYQYI